MESEKVKVHHVISGLNAGTINPQSSLLSGAPDKETQIKTSEDIEKLTKTLESKKEESLVLTSPVTFSYYDLLKLIYLEKQSKATKVQVHNKLRAHSQVQDLQKKIQQTRSSGANVSSIFIDAVYGKSEKLDGSYLLIDNIDLVLHLSQDDIAEVKGFGESSTKNSKANFSVIAGKLRSGAGFMINVRRQGAETNAMSMHIGWSTGEMLNVNINGLENAANKASQEESKSNENGNGTLEEAAKALRVYYCTVYSAKKSIGVNLKYVGEKVVPARSIGTAEFLDEGLFWPTSYNQAIVDTGLYSDKQERVKIIYEKVVQTGEPFEYIPSHDEILKNPFSGNCKPIIYIPSVPGKRKDSEMKEALKNGYVVLAEKPAFANAELAKEFSSTIDPDHKKRLFFGWHYLHHYIYRKLANDISKNSFGKIKHIKTYFSVPKPLKDPDSRIFNPSQGGVGLDVYSYDLHFVLRLVGFNHSFEVAKSLITSAQELDPKEPKLSKIDFTIDSQIKFGNGTVADLYATFDNDKGLHTEATITFEDGTLIMCKDYCHPQTLIKLNFEAIMIFRPGANKWEDYMTKEERENPEYWETTYERQIEFIRKQATGEGHYDSVNNDVEGIGVDTNIKVHEIIDAIFIAGGFEKKTGAD